MLKEKAANNNQQMEHMYHTIEQLRRFLGEVRRANGPEVIAGAGRQEIIDRVSWQSS